MVVRISFIYWNLFERRARRSSLHSLEAPLRIRRLWYLANLEIFVNNFLILEIFSWMRTMNLQSLNAWLHLNCNMTGKHETTIAIRTKIFHSIHKFWNSICIQLIFLNRWPISRTWFPNELANCCASNDIWKISNKY